MRYRSKPVEIEAIQWNGMNQRELEIFTHGMMTFHEIRANGNELVVVSAQVWDVLQDTWVNVNHGDMIIKGTEGEFYPCAHEVFQKKYEPVQDLGLYEGTLQK